MTEWKSTVPFFVFVFVKIFAKNVTPGNVILRRVGLRTVSHCAKSDSVQYHTAASQEIEMAENPNLFNTAELDSAHCDTAPSRTPRSVILRGVRLRKVFACSESNNFFFYSKTFISMTFRIYVMIFRKNSKIFRKSKNG